MVESLFRLENDRMVYMNWSQNVSFCLSKYKINKTHIHMLRPQFPSAISNRFFNQSINRSILRKSNRTQFMLNWYSKGFHFLDIYLQMRQNILKDEL
jgi:hypothetical protein